MSASFIPSFTGGRFTPASMPSKTLSDGPLKASGGLYSAQNQYRSRNAGRGRVRVQSLWGWTSQVWLSMWGLHPAGRNFPPLGDGRSGAIGLSQ
jgi:hypothetical protein